MITIAIESRAVNYSRYNVIVMCGGFDASASQLYVSAAQGDGSEPRCSLVVEDAYAIEPIFYIIPKSLPEGKNSPIEDNPPFEAIITISKDGKELYNMSHKVNAWGGSAIKLKLDI